MPRDVKQNHVCASCDSYREILLYMVQVAPSEFCEVYVLVPFPHYLCQDPGVCTMAFHVRLRRQGETENPLLNQELRDKLTSDG